jgi:hypothetical protein
MRGFEFISSRFRRLEMKKLLCIFLVLFGFGSFASAQSSSFGIKFGLPFIFALQVGHDFAESNKGFGVHAFAGATVMGQSGIVGAGIDAFLRTPFGQYGSSAFVGLSGSVLFLINNFPSAPPQANGFALFLGLLLGVEFVLGDGWSIELEFQPIAVFVPSNASAQFVPAQTFSLGINTRF